MFDNFYKKFINEVTTSPPQALFCEQKECNTRVCYGTPCFYQQNKDMIGGGIVVLQVLLFIMVKMLLKLQ